MLQALLVAFLLAGSSPLAAEAAAPQPPVPVLEVAGSAEPIPLSAELLHRLPRLSAATPASEHGAAATFEGVSLRDLLSEAKVPAGKSIRGEYLSWVVVVDAADGYRAAYALAELDPVFTANRTLLVDTRDGKPLPPEEGPLRMLLPDEKRPARWVRQVQRIWVGPISLPK